MGRRIEKTEYLPEPLISRLKIYCRGNLIWLYREHEEFRGLGIQNFYAALRGDPITEENIMRFRNLDYKLSDTGAYKATAALFKDPK